MARNKLLHNQNDTDPMGTVANLFDVAMVFAVALMVALLWPFGWGVNVSTRQPIQYDRNFLQRRLYDGKESRTREHGDYHKRR